MILFTYNQKGKVLGTVTTKRPIIIIDNGVESIYSSDLDSPEEIFEENAIVIYPEDQVSVLVNPALEIGTRIRIRRATRVVVNDGGALQEYRTFKETVRNLLSERNIKMGKIDRLCPAFDTTLTNNLKITIIRVKVKEIVQTETIGFKTEYKDDPNTYIGQTRIGQREENGKKKVRYRLTYENGRLVSKKPIKTKIISPPQNKIIYKGTKPFSIQEGMASWHWGETASRRYSVGTKLRVTNLANGNSTITIVGGWGPQVYTGRVIDLNINAFEAIASSAEGTIRVRVEEIG